jgi:hypothetical protein
VTASLTRKRPDVRVISSPPSNPNKTKPLIGNRQACRLRKKQAKGSRSQPIRDPYGTQAGSYALPIGRCFFN